MLFCDRVAIREVQELFVSGPWLLSYLVFLDGSPAYFWAIEVLRLIAIRAVIDSVLFIKFLLNMNVSQLSFIKLQFYEIRSQ